MHHIARAASVTLMLRPAAAGAITVSQTNSTIGVVDSSFMDRPVTFTETGPITDITVIVDFNK